MGTPFLVYTKFIKKAQVQRRKILSNNSKFIEIPIFIAKTKPVPKWMLSLPLFWSVLKGNLSLIGSDMIDYNENEKKISRTVTLKPGIVGLVQLNKNSVLSAEEKQHYDLFYLKNYSPVLDLEIIIKSIFKI